MTLTSMLTVFCSGRVAFTERALRSGVTFARLTPNKWNEWSDRSKRSVPRPTRKSIHFPLPALERFSRLAVNSQEGESLETLVKMWVFYALGWARVRKWLAGWFFSAFVFFKFGIKCKEAPELGVVSCFIPLISPCVDLCALDRRCIQRPIQPHNTAK